MGRVAFRVGTLPYAESGVPGPEPETERAIDGRTLVRYCSCMANDRSYLAMLQDYYAASSGVAVATRRSASCWPQVQVVGRGVWWPDSSFRLFLESTPDRRLAPDKAGSSPGRLPESPVHGGRAQSGRGRRTRRADDRRLPDRTAVADGAHPRQGRFDAGRRHSRRRSRRRREDAPRPKAAMSSSRSSTASSR